MIDLFSVTESALQVLSKDIELVDIERSSSGLLRIIIDKIGGVYIEDCENVSHHLSHVFAVENIDYKNLEVSSPGIDRPLRKESDFVRFVGERIEIKFYNAFNNKKIFRGILFLEETSTSNYDETSRLDSYDMKFGIKVDNLGDKNDPQIINFVLNDVDRAKLDPVLDFKGKRQ
ncbi:hypothetical protein CDSE_0680 [Candidatus Kinetoplastibacterium desouzaii TCC079E]|uniref:Ribosome maturation factor RimP n=1 Tax=Candidatus Kinetoplastidibacterium desouzai TCC079E TaxID=1208919 RepID=M1LUH8_9PROT|nr:ribosome maturation factor RimP [Candidatus Kinetoplastibacterium desouzaii]AGF46964.1 hypothetical protein CDSE_0680 [Candidatus Kinetoplastibacterium desouzaii TCC079E]